MIGIAVLVVVLNQVFTLDSISSGSDVDVAPGSTGDAIMGLLTTFGPLLGLTAAVVAFGLLIAFLSDSGGF